MQGSGNLAKASIALTGDQAVSAVGQATGGNGGSGGTATVTAGAIGTTEVHSDATATGGVGAGSAANASAIATATGASGSLSATAHSDPGGSVLIRALDATAGGDLDGSATARASTTIGGAVASYRADTQAIATATALPQSSDTGKVTSSNAHLAAAFGGSAHYLAEGELGALHDSNGTHNETMTAQLQLSVDASQLSGSDDLIIGLFNPKGIASVMSVVFDVSANGTSLLHQSFNSATAARSYFTDHALDLGTVSSLSSGGPIGLSVSLQETTSASGTGVFTGLLIGTGHSMA